MKIVIAGPKGAGKSTVGKALAEITGLSLVETDQMIEAHFEKVCGRKLTCRQIYHEFGEQKFRQAEKDIIGDLENADWQIIVCGGSSLIDAHSRQALQKNAVWIYLKAQTDAIWARMEKDGLPPWLQENPWAKDQLSQNDAFREALLAPFSDIIIDTTDKQPAEIAGQIADELSRLLAIRQTASNTYGDIIRVTTFGESHGPAIGAVFDGVRPGIEITAEDIQAQLNRRRPGQSDVTTPRDEKDQVEILSGVFDGKTTGAPIAMVIFNRDHDSSKYEGIKDLFRPGHADYTFYKKYGIRDHRGGGRSSGRETAGRVTCGAVARKWLTQKGVKIIAHSIEIAGIKAQSCDYDAIEKNDVRCADTAAAEIMKQAILAAKDDNDSVGGIVKLEIHGLPAGLGDPVFGKLDARITGAIMTIGAIKGIEIGQGFGLTRLRGSQSNDNMSDGGFKTNNAGGITGGISTGQTICLQIAVKPTSSIARPQQTIDHDGRTCPIETHGRHDPCIVPRIIPVIENMTALALYDCWQIQSRINPDFA
jgi:chorismate synthase